MFPAVPAWGDRRLVVLAGAGISAVPPSDLPDWWQFNQAVLDGIRKHLFATNFVEQPLVSALERITLDDINVTLFSEVVHSAFAGAQWFDLVARLDGSVPSPCHDALAGLAAEGRLAAVVTTNFDTLIERAFEDRGIPVDVDIVTPDLHPVPLSGDTCRLIKIHGSVSATSSLVDLAGQKARGVPHLVRAWLARLFTEHPLLVAGFSGRDLELGEDYLGLSAAAPLVRWLRWITPDVQRALPAVEHLVRTAPNGAFTDGRLPEIFTSLGIAVPSPRPRRTPGESIDDWVTEWLRDTLPSPDVCAAVCAKMLKYVGDEASARDLRQVLRTSMGERTRFSAVEAIYCSVALAIIGTDEVGIDNAQAQADMEFSRTLSDAVYAGLTETGLSSGSRREQAANLVLVLINSAMAAVASGDVATAKGVLNQVRAMVEKQSEPEPAKYAHAASFIVSGFISHYEDNPSNLRFALAFGGVAAGRDTRRAAAFLCLAALRTSNGVEAARQPCLCHLPDETVQRTRLEARPGPQTQTSC